MPWVIADYTSPELDLADPACFRDLSKPMGALGERRAEQFRERYEGLASIPKAIESMHGGKVLRAVVSY